jgi:hypothetical protein
MPPDDATAADSNANGGRSAPAHTPGAEGREPAPSLGRELEGDLPCVVCGYNLRGLSIRSMCPECGTGVRATILSVVDPLASELRPIDFPRLTAAGVVLWAAGAVAVAAMSWLPQAADALHFLGVRGVDRPSAALGVLLGVCTSGVGSLALIRPHAGIPRVQSVLAGLATACYVPLAIVLWNYHTDMDIVGGPHYLSGWRPGVDAVLSLASAGALIALIVMFERPNARLLVARSLVMRTGRVDRQTMWVMAVAACVLAVGALLGAAPSRSPGVVDALRTIGVGLIVLSSLLLSIGALGSLLDCVRIAGAILIPKVTLRQVIREGRPRSRLMEVIDPMRPASAEEAGRKRSGGEEESARGETRGGETGIGETGIGESGAP